MFKSKSSLELPLPPSVPIWEQMEEDLAVAMPDDAIFILVRGSSETAGDSQSIPQDPGTGQDEKPEFTEDMKELISMSQQCVEIQEALSEVMKPLQEHKDKTQTVADQLQDSLEKVKKKAFGAVAGSSEDVL